MAQNPNTAGADRLVWRDLFRDGRGMTTFILNLGVLLHAIVLLLISTVMPSVVEDIGGLPYYAWVTMLYMLSSIIGAACGGPVAAKLGSRHAYALAGAIFLVALVGCALAPNMAVLLFARTVQGFGGGLLNAQSFGFVSRLYHGNLRPYMLSTLTATWTLAALLGPLFGGIAAEIGWWRAAFWMIVPFAATFIALVWRYMAQSIAAGSATAFPVGRLALLGTGVLCVGIMGNIDSMPARFALLMVAILFVLRTFQTDRGAANRLFPSNPLSVTTMVGTGYWMVFLISVTYTALVVYLPLALQVLHGTSPLFAGYFNAIITVAWATGSVAVTTWRGRWELLALADGPVLMAAAFYALAAGLTELPLAGIALLLALAGFGLGAGNLHIVKWIMAAALPGEEGITGSSMVTMRALGVTFGAAAAGVIANAAGLGQGISIETVGTATVWILWFIALATSAMAMFGFRALRLVGNPEPAIAE